MIVRTKIWMDEMSITTSYKVFDLEHFTLYATRFQRWRMKRLINKLNREQLILLDKITHTAMEVKVYSPGSMLGPYYTMNAYTSDAVYILRDDRVHASYKIDKPNGDFDDGYDSNTNQWYSYGESITWSNKLFKLLMLYNRVMGAYSVRVEAAQSRDKFMSKLTGTDNV